MEPYVVHFEGEAVVHLPDDSDATVWVELVGGRDRHSVGGQIAEGPRWWHGRISMRHRVCRVPAGAELHVRLENGRTARVVVEHTTPDPEPTAAIRGLGPPPFEVD